MQVDDQRLTRKDAVFDNVKILNGNQIPLTNTLADKLPLRGSLIALKSGNIHDLYYGDGLQWVPVTDGGSTADPPLVEVLAAGNITGGNDIEITNGDAIVSENGGVLTLRGTGSTSRILIDSQGTGTDAVDINSSGGVAISSSLNERILIESDGQLLLTSDSSDPSSIFINATNVAGGIDINAGTSTGGITMDAGSGGVAIDTSGQISLTSGTGTQSILTMNASGVVEVQADHFTISSIDGSPATASHLHSAQTDAPTLSTVGTASLASFIGNASDMAGQVEFTPGADPGSLVVTFAKPYPTADISVTLTSGNSGAVAAQALVNVKATDFEIIPTVDPAGNARFFYHVIYLE